MSASIEAWSRRSGRHRLWRVGSAAEPVAEPLGDPAAEDLAVDPAVESPAVEDPAADAAAGGSVMRRIVSVLI